MSRRSGVPSDKILSEHHHPWARIYIRTDDVVEVHLHPGRYNSEKVLGVIEEIKRLKNKQQLLILTIPHKRSMSTLSGVKAVFSKPGVDYSMAKAYVFPSYLQYIIARAGRLYFRPTTPMRFFRNRETAESWLKTFQGYGI
jgi:hypothetical protein